MPRSRYAVMVVNGRDAGREDDGPEILELVLAHTKERPSSPALKDDDESLSYAELSDRVSVVASGLTSLGVGPKTGWRSSCPIRRPSWSSRWRACGPGPCSSRCLRRIQLTGYTGSSRTASRDC